MMPDHALSAQPHPARFAYPVREYGSPLTDVSMGGVALNDPSQGLDVKVWTATMDGDNVTVFADDVAPTTVLSVPGVTSLALAFDQNMLPFIAYEQGDDAAFWWYDATIQAPRTTALPAGSHGVQATLDERRELERGISDVVLAYIRANHLYTREQRDRYEVEYDLGEVNGGGR